MQNGRMIAVGLCLVTALAGVALAQAPTSSRPAKSGEAPAVAIPRGEREMLAAQLAARDAVQQQEAAADIREPMGAGPSTAPAESLRVLTTASATKDSSTKYMVVMERLPEPTTQQSIQTIAQAKREGRPIVDATPASSFSRSAGNVAICLLKLRGNGRPEHLQDANILQVAYTMVIPGLRPQQTFSAELVWTDEGVGYLVLSQYATHHVTLTAFAIPADGKPIAQYPLDQRNRPKPAVPLGEFLDWLPGDEPIVGVTVEAEGRKLVAQVARIHSVTGAAVAPTVLEFDPASGKWRLVE